MGLQLNGQSVSLRRIISGFDSQWTYISQALRSQVPFYKRIFNAHTVSGAIFNLFGDKRIIVIYVSYKFWAIKQQSIIFFFYHFLDLILINRGKESKNDKKKYYTPNCLQLCPLSFKRKSPSVSSDEPTFLYSFSFTERLLFLQEHYLPLPFLLQ